MDRLMPEARRTSDAASTLIDLARVPRLPQVSSDGSCGGGSASMLVGIVVALRRSGINPTVFCNFASLLPLATVTDPDLVRARQYGWDLREYACAVETLVRPT